MGGRQVSLSLEEYRRKIREVWLPIIGKKRLTSYELRLVQQWFNFRVPVEAVLQAIEQCTKRCNTAYSLGIVKGDLQGILRRRARNEVGKPRQEQEPMAWRERFSETLEGIIEQTTNPESVLMYRELQRQLPKLSQKQANERWREIYDGGRS